MARNSKKCDHQLLVDEIITNFPDIKKCATYEQTIKFVMDRKDLIKSQMEKKWEIYSPSRPKTAGKANELRALGNEQYLDGEHYLALESYTESILHAPAATEDRCLALGYGNRSAILSILEEDQECCEDVDRALAAGYPADKVYKLHKRKGKSLMFLGKPDLAMESFYKALNSLNDSNDSSRDKTSAKIGEKIDECFLLCCGEEEEEKETGDNLPSLFVGENPNFENASSAICLKYKRNVGRFVEAKRFIPEDSVLFVEKAFTTMVYKDYYHENHPCINCYEKTHAPIPCLNCTEVTFCSEKCREEAWNKFHKLECQYMEFHLVMRHQTLAMRALLTAGLDAVVDMKDELERKTSKTKITGLNKDGKYKHSYYTLYHLQQSTQNVDNYKKMIYSVLEICQFMWQMQMQTCATLDEKTSFGIMDAISKSPFFNENKYFIATLMFRHCQQLQCKEITIMDNPHASTNDECLTSDRVGTALCPCVSMMNHSCTPNTISRFYNGYVIVTASKNIGEGDEVCTCNDFYHYLAHLSEERQSHLKCTYNCECKCRPCIMASGVCNITIS